jgi:ABC-type Fe3+-hydroxamate transport system substrate-binding protein
VPVFVSLPRRFEQGVAHIARVARILGVEATAKDLLRRAYAIKPRAAQKRAFVPIWMDPLMTLNAETFGSDMLAYAGIGNAFGDRERLYPLAADLGKSAPQDAAGRDVRYPRITLDEVAARKPDVVILPDEPYAFTAADADMFRDKLQVPVVHVSGKDLFWYGAWQVDAVERLARVLA